MSAPSFTYRTVGLNTANVCDVNAFGVPNEYMMSLRSLDPAVKVGGDKAVYTCPGGSTGAYAQCEAATCFRSTTGNVFPGVGQVADDEIICSCPLVTPATSDLPFGWQFVGPWPCDPDAFPVCAQDPKNGDFVPVGSPPGAARTLQELLYGRVYDVNECFLQQGKRAGP